MKLTSQDQVKLLDLLRIRFEKNPSRHSGIKWNDVEKRVLQSPEKLVTLYHMEQSGGEPDVVDFDAPTKKYIFFDCSTESPSSRRSLCYDADALKSRKVAKPKSSAVFEAQQMGTELLSEKDYKYLQSLGKFDLKTSSWLHTPAEIRKRGGAIFADRRYDHVFVYHNGAESYYAARGFRTKVTV